MSIDALGSARFLTEKGKKTEANKVLDIVYPYCNTIPQLDAIAELYAKNRNFKKTLEIGLKLLSAIDNRDAKYNLRTNLARAYLGLNMPDEAMHYIKANEFLNPEDQANLMDKAYVYFLKNEKDTGEDILRKILENPSSEDIFNRTTYNMGSHNLRKGNFKEGLRQFLIGGKKLDIWKNISLPNNKYWDGKPLPGETVLLVAEGGIGDEIINIRFCKHIKDLGMNPVWYTDRKDLAELFTRCGYTTITNLSEIPPSWYWFYSMSAPVLLDLEEKDLYYGPYLLAKEHPIKSTKIRIGIKTMGNPEYDNDLARTIPLNDLVNTLPDNVEIYSFHKDEELSHPRVINWMTKDTTWEDTLNKIEEMDLIISSCTSLVHAAGSLGKSTIVFAPILKYYLWSNDKETSPWYSSVTVLHQQKLNSWEAPFQRLQEILKERMYDKTLQRV